MMLKKESRQNREVITIPYFEMEKEEDEKHPHIVMDHLSLYLFIDVCVGLLY
jgi:hypothetical protein